MDIAAFTKRMLDQFDKIRGKKVEGNFWDLVVLTASDKDQAGAFEQQIELKKKLNHLPLGVEYIVYHDPPGPKIGCGGSTICVIHSLHSVYGEDLWNQKVLLLNAGGQSQRLPSASVLGKIFTALPIGEPMYQLFDFKLACYMPLLENMKPGFFHAASDTIEVYDLGMDKSRYSMDKPGFTALAHPSSLEIGQTHGVFVLEETDEQVVTSMRNCLEVLQKPSVEKMRKRGAVLTKSNGEEFVYTDSCFYFDHKVSQKLLQFYNEHPIECEIDSYGDFLQCLGPGATVDYTKDVKNVKSVESKLVETRVQIFHLLKGSTLNILALEASKFYHFGTMSEYIENLCNDPVIASELGFKRHIFSDLPRQQSTANNEDLSNGEPVEKRIKVSYSGRECIMSCVLGGSGSHVSPSSVVEYCDFQQLVSIGSNCIVSNCQLLGSTLSEKAITIPPGTFMHTVWIDNAEGVVQGAVTLIIGINDNVKKSVTMKGSNELRWFGKPFLDVINSLQFDVEKVFHSPYNCSLWTAKVFPVCKSMSESFQASYELLQCVVQGGKQTCMHAEDMVSMEDIVQRKSVSKMLEYRKELYGKISSKKESLEVDSKL